MHSHVEISARDICRCVAALALIAASAAGCSSDVARFNNNPNASPYADARPPAAPCRDVTGSVAPGRVESSRCRRRSSAGPQAAALAAAASRIATRRPAPPIRDVTGAVAPPPAQCRRAHPAAARRGRCRAAPPITVGPGETIDIFRNSYGVPASAIMQANNLQPEQHVQPGQRLMIPRYNLVPGAAAAPAQPPPVACAAAAPARASHVVASKETLSSIAKRYGKTRVALAQANHLAPDAKLKIGQRLTIPGLAPRRR